MKFWSPILVLLVALPALGQIRMPIQGSLTDGGTPIAGPVDLEVRVFTFEEQTCEVFTNVSLTNGVFNLLLGDTTNDCGATRPTAISPDVARDATSVQVTFNGDVFIFPVGELPRAAHAELCESAALLGSFDANTFLRPQTIYVPLGTFQDLIPLAVGTLYELAPGTHNVDDFTIPAGVTLRGAGRERTRVLGATITMSTAATIEGLSVDAGNKPNGVIINGATGLQALRDVGILGGVLTGLLINGVGSDTIVALSDLYVNIGNAGAIVGIDITGQIDVHGENIDIRAVSGTIGGIGLRLSGASNGAERLTRFNGLHIETAQSGAPSTGVESSRTDAVNINDAFIVSSGVDLRVSDGSIVVKDSDLRSGNASVEVLNPGGARILNSQIVSVRSAAGNDPFCFGVVFTNNTTASPSCN